MALIDTQDAVGGDRSLQVDRFGLSIGPVSVGLPLACTPDDVYRRYLDLMAVLHRGPRTEVTAPPADLEALSAATSAEPSYVAHRLAALQASATHAGSSLG